MKLKRHKSNEFAIRYGSDAYNTGAQEAIIVAEKLRKTFERHEIAQVGIVTSSFGVAIYQKNETVDHWVSRIDRALYQAKNEGRNTVRLASP